MNDRRPGKKVALVTGASRQRGIGAAIALGLADRGWDVATNYWRAYDVTMPWGSHPHEVEQLDAQLRARGAETAAVEADLADVATPTQIFDAVEAALGPVTALVLAHCQSVDSDILNTTVESFDLHFAINARATWLLVREFGRRFQGKAGDGRIIGLTSDHVAGNMPYGASKPPGNHGQRHRSRRDRYRLDEPGADSRVRKACSARPREQAGGLCQSSRLPLLGAGRLDQRPAAP